MCSANVIAGMDFSGKLVICPKCKKQIEVPGPARVILSDAPAPISSGHQQEHKDIDVGLTLRSRNCTIAYVSFGLVCASILTGGLLLLPGIVCGHIAIGQCNRNRDLIGKSYATAALIIGYILVGIAAIIILGLLGIMSFSS